MKVWARHGGEIDWVAANTKEEALETLRRQHGLRADELAEYSDIEELPDDAEFLTDEIDAETEEPVTTTAAELVAGKTQPFWIGTTYI